MNYTGNSYQLDNQGTPLEFADYIWKTSEETYLVSSPEIRLTLPDGTEKSMDSYMELDYVDAVSYTHLDVYKRQRHTCTGWRGSGIGVSPDSCGGDTGSRPTTVRSAARS